MLDADGSTDPRGDPRVSSTRCSTGRTSPRARGSCRAAVASTSRLLRQARQPVPQRDSSTRSSAPATRDLCYGYNAFWRDVPADINVDCAGFEVETLINVRDRQGWAERRRGPQHRARADSRSQQAASAPRRLPRAADDPASSVSPGAQRGSLPPRQSASSITTVMRVAR